MKHLKIFESFRKEGIMNDILDMSLDIQDDGYRVKSVEDGDESFIITIDKFEWGYREAFDIKEIKDFLIRVIEYGNNNPCEITIYVPQRNHSNQTDTMDLRTLKSEWILDYRISFVGIYVRTFK